MKFSPVLIIGALAITGTVAAPIDTDTLGTATITDTNTDINYGDYNAAGATAGAMTGSTAGAMTGSTAGAMTGSTAGAITGSTAGTTTGTTTGADAGANAGAGIRGGRWQGSRWQGGRSGRYGTYTKTPSSPANYGTYRRRWVNRAKSLFI
ncbi:hypothetical protein MCOR25_000532 [Pyricularia grisea]|nr:hypothetical protein MCOR25_000532 [Pyricularia grisea]